MSKYNLDLDYVIPSIDISKEELNEIIAEADKIIQENTESSEKLAIAYLKKAQCLQKLEEYKEKEYRETEEKKPGLHGGITISDDSETYRDDTQEYIKSLIEKALELYPNMPQALMQMGKYYVNMSIFKNENIDKAIDMYTTAIQLKPDYAAAFNNRGGIYASDAYYRAQNKENDMFFGEVFVMDGCYDSIIYNFCLGRSYAKLMEEHYAPDTNSSEKIIKFQDNWNKAINDYTEAIRIRHFDAIYYFNRAQTYSNLREHEKAIEDFSSAIHYGSDGFKKNTYIFLLRGKEYIEIKDYEKAIVDFSEAMRLMPDQNNLLCLRGFAYLMAGNKEKAAMDMDEYYRRGSDNESDSSSKKCSFCGLPSMFTSGLSKRGDGPWVCSKCKKKNKEIEEVKKESDEFDDWFDEMMDSIKNDRILKQASLINFTPNEIRTMPLDTLDHEELCLLLESYKIIDITPDDYQRMLDIAQRAYQIGNPPGEGIKYREHWEEIIKPLEDLVSKTKENNTNV